MFVDWFGKQVARWSEVEPWAGAVVDILVGK